MTQARCERTNKFPYQYPGYSPFLSLDVDDMDTAVAICAQMGANLDGPVRYPAHGKDATLRALDGHMIGLYKPTT